MKYDFEIYINSDSLTIDNWQKFYKVFNSYSGLIGNLRLIVETKDKVIRIYAQCDKDLSAISNDLESMIIRELPSGSIEIPTASGKEHFINFVTGGSILDTKEKLFVKMGKDLQTVVFDIKSINSNNAYVKVSMYFKGLHGFTVANKTLTRFPSHLLAVNFSGSNSTYLKKKVNKYLDIEKSLHLFTSDYNQSLFKVDGFPYLRGDYYLNLYNYDFAKHSFIVGASGSGKSKLISLIVDRIASSQFKDQYSVVVIDPHNALKEEFLHIEDSTIVGFGNDSVELFNDSPKDIQAEAELTTMLFKSLMGSQYNPRLERVLKYSLFVLFTSKSMSLDQLKRFLTETDLRNQVIDHVTGYVPDNITRFFGADYNEIRTQHYNEAILPIISLVDEMSLQPGMISNGQASIAGMVNDRFLTLFSLNKVSMGEKVVKTVSGLIIQQLFLLAQARAFNDKKVILIIDEVSIVQNPALSQILAEARKFGLTVVLTQQYFGQIDKDLQDAIFANTYNYYVFKVSEEDARALEGNLSIELPKSIVESEGAGGLKEADIRVKILTELSPRECLVRLTENDKIHPCVKVSTVDAEFFQANSIKAQNLEKFNQIKLPEKFIESKKSVYELPTLNEANTAENPQALNDSSAILSEKTDNTSTNNLVRVNQTTTQDGNETVLLKREDATDSSAETAGYNNDDFINISLLLAEQSSSRKLVNEYKKGYK